MIGGNLLYLHLRSLSSSSPSPSPYNTIDPHSFNFRISPNVSKRAGLVTHEGKPRLDKCGSFGEPSGESERMLRRQAMIGWGLHDRSQSVRWVKEVHLSTTGWSAVPIKRGWFGDMRW